VQELAGVIGDITGCKAAARHEPARAGDVAFSLASTELALAALGFRARTSLADGLRTMVGR
jgi:nucleoside-diphosphate-sugar epimerase